MTIDLMYFLAKALLFKRFVVNFMCVFHVFIILRLFTVYLRTYMTIKGKTRFIIKEEIVGETVKDKTEERVLMFIHRDI